MAIAIKPTPEGLVLTCLECGFSTTGPDEIMFGHDCEVTE